MERAIRPWWGEFDLAPDQGRRWQVGPLALQVVRRRQEWRVAWQTGPDALDDTLEIAAPLAPDALEEAPPEMTLHRYAMQGASALRLAPMLADRPVVVRPDVPLHLPGGREARIYVSSPVWVKVEVGGEPLLELPSYRMSDTWFGPSTRVGELCYASRTSARLRLELLPRRHARVVTEVRVVNRASAPLMFERLKVPLPSLALFGGPEGLWTQSLTVTWMPNGTTDVDLGRPPVGAPERLAGPRHTESLNAIARAFGAFVG